MSHTLPTSELPKSLQELIAVAGTEVQSWKDDGQDSPISNDDKLPFQPVREWTLQLSRGEYEEHLYWECVAEDAEVAGEWSRAKSAYQTIVGLHDAGFYWGKAYRGLATLSSLLGQPKEALKYCRAASRCERRQAGVLYRLSVSKEAWQLFRLGRVHSAQWALRRGMATFQPGHCDYLNYATLHIVSAACQIARNSLSNAEELLKTARTSLEVLVPQDDKVNAGCGSLSAYAWWWQVEAERCRAAGLPDQELAALRHRLDHASLATTGWKRLDLDAGVMQAWDDLADAYERRGRADEATEARREADRIRNQWHLPTIQKPQPGLFHRIVSAFSQRLGKR
jgi:tetratricopeptide (TPR) repeat protein